MGSFIFWLILPYIIAAFVLAARKRLTDPEHRKGSAMRIGREFAAAAKRSIANE